MHEEPMFPICLTACPDNVPVRTFLTERLGRAAATVKPKRQAHCCGFPPRVDVLAEVDE